MKRFLLPVLLALAAIVPLANAAPAAASSCYNVQSLAPYVPLHTVSATTDVTCDTDYEIQLVIHISTTGPYQWTSQQFDYFMSAGASYFGWETGSNCVLAGVTDWGDWMHYRVRWLNVGGSVFGPWHDSTPSGGTVAGCG